MTIRTSDAASRLLVRGYAGSFPAQNEGLRCGAWCWVWQSSSVPPLHSHEASPYTSHEQHQNDFATQSGLNLCILLCTRSVHRDRSIYRQVQVSCRVLYLLEKLTDGQGSSGAG